MLEGERRVEGQRHTLGITCTATGLMVAAITGVVLALPQIGSDLDASLSDLQWIVNGFALALATGMLAAGSLGDRYGHAWVLAAGVAIVAVTSLLAGVAASASVLVVARTVCGFGASAVLACSLALLAEAFPGEQRRGAMQWWGLSVGLGTAAGCLLGGALSGWPSWRWMFLLIGLAMSLLVPRAARLQSRSGAGKTLDWGGIALFGLGVFLALLALTRGNDDGWTSVRTLVLVGAAVALLSVFGSLQRRLAEPAIDPELLRNPSFQASAIGSIVLFAAHSAAWIYIVMYLREQAHYSPLQLALQSMPMALMAVAGSLATERLRRVAPNSVASAALGWGSSPPD